MTTVTKIVTGLPFTRDDGGRKATGYKGAANDCTCRAIAIAADLPYQAIYDEINRVSASERPRKGNGKSSARLGTYRQTTDKVLAALGFTWTPTMAIGSGCRVHMRPGELPMGRLVVRLSKHLAAVINGVVHDLNDPCRCGTRCVYGYYTARSDGGA